MHNDINGTNVIVSDVELTALLDSDDVEIAPVEEDFWALFKMLVTKGEPHRCAMRWIHELSPESTRHQGFRERCLLRQAYEILYHATTHHSSDGAPASLAEAEAQFLDTFERGTFDSWFSG